MMMVMNHDDVSVGEVAGVFYMLVGKAVVGLRIEILLDILCWCVAIGS